MNTVPLLPAHIGRYRVLRRLGAGGMGVVYLGEDPDLGRRVALKMLPRATATPSRLAELEREAKTLASIDHPAVATVYALERAAGETAIVMEYVAGVTLARQLAAGALGLTRSIAVLRHIARALEAVHALGVVHRDLKPSNVMLLPDERVKVLDFGIAARATSADDGGAEAGTPGYASPEQLRGDPVDARADLFALGAIAWECLTGSPAFPGETGLARIAATLERVPAVADLPAGLPAVIRALIGDALAQDRSRRPEAASAFLDAFESVTDDSPTETGPIAGERRTARRLPADASRFVGRQGEIDEVLARLRTSRLVTLTGVGGSGKTRLAIAAARRADAVDGVFYCELAPVSTPDQVVAALARAVDAAEIPGTSMESSIEAHLAPLSVLLIVDNCEHVLELVARLVDGLLGAAPGVRVLATSREALDVPGESIFHVPPMSLPDPDRADPGASDAVALFQDRARRHRPDFVLDAARTATVVDICRRVDGVPLAIELAAARLRVLTVEEISSRLSKRLKLLTGGDRTAPARHRTLRAAIDWSCDQLEPGERHLFVRLGVFAGGFTLEAAEAVCAAPDEEDAVLDDLTQLVQKSLVEAMPDGRETRYRLLECVREYADEKLDGEDRADVLARHVGFYKALGNLAKAHYHTSEQRYWLERQTREYENMRAAISSAEASGDGTSAIEIACSLTRFWELRSRFAEGLALFGRLRVKHGTRRDQLYARMMNDAGLLAYAHGDNHLARRHYEEARAVWEALDLHDNLSGVLNNLGLVYARAGELERAIEHFDRAQAINRRIGNRAWESTNLLNRGFAYRDLGQLERARADLEEGIEILEEIGDRATLAAAYDNLGTLAEDEERHEDAHALHRQSLEINRSLENPRGIAQSLGNLAMSELHLGNFERTRELLRESLALKHELETDLGIAHALESFASLALTEEQWARGAWLLSAAERIRDELGAPVPAVDREAMEAGVFRGRRAIGDEAIDQAAAAGRAASTDEAVAEAMGPDAP